MTQRNFTPRIFSGAFCSCGLEPSRFNRLVEAFDVFSAGFTDEVILDLTAVQEEDTDMLETTLGIPLEKFASELVRFYPEVPRELTSYAVVYREHDQSIAEAPMVYPCWAEDVDHAEEQCLDDVGDADVLWVLAEVEALNPAALRDFALASYYSAGSAVPSEATSYAYWKQHGFDRDTFHDFVVAHGYGGPSAAGYVQGLALLIEHEYPDYAEAASEIVARRLTETPDDDSGTEGQS